jgi:hypothetical protein
LAVKINPKKVKYYLIESNSRYGSCWGYQVYDSQPILCGSWEAAMDTIFALQRGQRIDDTAIPAAHHVVDLDEISDSDALTVEGYHDDAL